MTMVYLRDVSSVVRDGIPPRDLLPPPGATVLTPSATYTPPASGGGGGPGTADVRIVELNLGPLPVKETSLLVNDDRVTPTSRVEATLSGVPGTGKMADEPGMDDIMLLATPKQGHISFYVRGREGYIAGAFNVTYIVGND